MTSIGLELILMTFLLIYFGVFLTQDFYEQSKRALLHKNYFCNKSLTNPYCIME